jgi:hypothetical protein
MAFREAARNLDARPVPPSYLIIPGQDPSKAKGPTLKIGCSRKDGVGLILGAERLGPYELQAPAIYSHFFRSGQISFSGRLRPVQRMIGKFSYGIE